MSLPATTRPELILADYIRLIDEHLDNLVNLKADHMFEIADFAEQLHIHPTHLSNTIHELTGTSPCGLYQPRILEVARRLLAQPSYTIRQIALLLTFEPSQFTKWFRRFTGQTQQQYRKFLKS